ncbi:hypothetical protein HH310_42355 [Actinoplanes sp. TBRC 11911]|uniref:hypothetical protein n=1 Tax=Actinoplanes sp. TBRC 11911 TaxID=2729386 RepID=UPI00145F2342|nr:hypothetical protein [Actinoplanes sp. TBRC 11911]NMO57793.1 hypothetical protein [Actinoplanes sp. TBRC 11911]
MTEYAVELIEQTFGERRVKVWADRPARGLTRIMLADEDGQSCGDAILRGETFTVVLPDSWRAEDRVALTCMIAQVVHGLGTVA